MEYIVIIIGPGIFGAIAAFVLRRAAITQTIKSSAIIATSLVGYAASLQMSQETIVQPRLERDLQASISDGIERGNKDIPKLLNAKADLANVKLENGVLSYRYEVAENGAGMMRLADMHGAKLLAQDACVQWRRQFSAGLLREVRYSVTSTTFTHEIALTPDNCV